MSLISEHGRKFIVTIYGMSLVAGLATLGMFLAADATFITATSGALGAMVATFCGANAVVSWSYARNDNSASTRNEVVERRAAGADDQTEPTG